MSESVYLRSTWPVPSSLRVSHLILHRLDTEDAWNGGRRATHVSVADVIKSFDSVDSGIVAPVNFICTVASPIWNTSGRSPPSFPRQLFANNHHCAGRCSSPCCPVYHLIRQVGWSGGVRFQVRPAEHSTPFSALVLRHLPPRTVVCGVASAGAIPLSFKVKLDIVRSKLISPGLRELKVPMCRSPVLDPCVQPP